MSGAMNDAGNRDLMDKLGKILALTSSPNEHEAAAAADHLQRLLTKYNLDIADLEKRGAKERPGVERAAHDLGKAAFKWKLNLAEGIAGHYYCHPMVNHLTKTVAFVGRPDNVQSLQMLYGWIIDQIRRLAKEERRVHFEATGEHIDPLRWQVNFGIGCVHRLVERLQEMKAREEEDAVFEAAENGTSTALAVMSSERNREISDWLEEQGLRRIDGRETKRDREWRERYEARDAMLRELKVTDIEAYYRECPWERPKTPEQLAAEEKRRKEEERREARNRRKRENYIPTGGYREAKYDPAKADQGWTARESGKQAAARVNLRPFIAGGSKKGEIE